MVLKEMGIDLEGEDPGDVSKCMLHASGVETVLLYSSCGRIRQKVDAFGGFTVKT